jgi:hypothetical protein
MSNFQIVKLLNPIVIDVGINPRGAYDNGTAYVTGDMVTYSGTSYIAISSTTANLPTDVSFWQVAPTGPQGIQGIQGDAGLDGTNGTNGTNGTGVPTGGTTAQVLSKIDGTDYNTQWVTPSGGGGGGGTWGSITGTLSTQTDLQTALDLKATIVYTDSKVADAINNGTITVAPSQNAVYDALALKANTTDIEPHLHNLMSTSLITSTSMSINANTAKFDIAAFSAVFIDNYTDPLNPVYTELNYAGSTANVVTNLATQDATIISMDKNGNILQTSSFITSTQQRDYVSLGGLIHITRTAINSINQWTSTVGIDIPNSLVDFSNSVGPINVSGNILSGNLSNTLKINKSAGETFKIGGNWDNNKQSPNIKVDASSNAASFFYGWRDGAGNFTTILTDTIIPDKYDDNTTGGVTSPNGVVATNKWQLFKVWRVIQSNVLAIEYGQVLYNSFDAAFAAKEVVTSVNPSAAPLQFRGWYIVRGAATDLNNIADAQFIDAGKFGISLGGSIGSSTTTLQGAYNNSVTPEVITDSTRLALTIQRGSGADTDTVFEGKNGAGTTTFSVTGNGALAASGAITGSNLSGTNTGDNSANTLYSGLAASKENTGVAASLDSAHLSAFAHADIAHTNRAALDLVSGTNTGDQDLSGYILSSTKGAASGVASLDTNGLIPIAQLPPAALERLVIVADQATRYALTTTTVQNGDTVKQTDTGEMYFIKDDTNLANSAGYSVYTAGSASSVPWGGITSIPAAVTALSGTNTGDQTNISGNAATVTTNANLTGVVTSSGNTTSIANSAITNAMLANTAVANLSGTNTGDQDLSGKVTGNTAITGATKTKITYDSKGLVTSGADATTADIADSTNKRYVTDANLTTIGNQSGTNTGDNSVNTLYSGLVTNATHTGDATGATALTVVKINGTLMSGLATGILKNTTSTGIPSIAIAADFPTLNQSTTGNADTATLATSTSALKSATTTVNVASATAPTTGQVLTATSTTAATWQTPSTGMTNPMTTGGDLIYGGASGAATRLANGTTGQVLSSNGTTTAPTWITLGAGSGDMILASVQTVTGAKTFGDVGAVNKFILAGSTSGSTIVNAAPIAGSTTMTLPAISGTISLNPMTAVGQIVYGGADGVETALGVGTAGQLLQSNASAAPTWVNPPSGGSSVPTGKIFSISNSFYNI